MALFGRRTAVAQQPERRLAKRRTVDCAARLKLLGGEREGRLSDLSEAGARFDTPDPPAKDMSGLLVWHDHAFFGKVVWAKDDSCGIVFERPIPHGIVEQTIAAAGPAHVPLGPVARFGQIPLGQKRGRGHLAIVE